MQAPSSADTYHASQPVGTVRNTPPLISPTSTHEPTYNYASSQHNQAPARTENTYSLTLFQQPCHSRTVGSGEKADRRPIDPPPVIKFDVSQSSNRIIKSVDLTLLRSPFFMCYATLCEANAPYQELSGIPNSNKPYMVGTIVTSMFQLRESKAPTKDTLGLPEGHYFVFYDLGVRVEGSYRLKFSVYEIVDRKVYHCKSTISERFQVYPAKNFPGMKHSTDISLFLAQQGMRMRVRTKNSTVPDVQENFKSALTASKRISKKKALDESGKLRSSSHPAQKLKPVSVTQPYPDPHPAGIKTASPTMIRPRNVGNNKHPPLPGPEGMLKGQKP